MNYRGPLEIELRAVSEPDPQDPAAEIGRFEAHFFATTNPEGKRVEVEMRAGRGGAVFVVPVDVIVPVDAPELPPNSTMRPVPPEARTTPFSIDDFEARGRVEVEDVQPTEEPEEPEPLSPEEQAELDAYLDPNAPRVDAREEMARIERERQAALAAARGEVSG